MWIVFALFSLLCYTAADLTAKKGMSSRRKIGLFDMLVTYEVTSFAFALLLFAFGVGESGKSPQIILTENPLIFAPLACFLMYWALFLLSLRFAGLSVEEAVSGTFGVFYFSGLLLINLFSGKLSAVRQMLHPLRLIPIIIVILFTFLLPNIEVLRQKKTESNREKSKRERKRMLIGLMFLLLAVLFDSLDSVVTTVIFDEKNVGTADFFISSHFVCPLLLIPAFIGYRIKNKKFYIPYKTGGKQATVFAVLLLASILLYMYASSLDAVKTGIVFIAYPVFPIIGAGLILKEKYTTGQKVCIWVITLASIFFCVTDYII